MIIRFGLQLKTRGVHTLKMLQACKVGHFAWSALEVVVLMLSVVDNCSGEEETKMRCARCPWITKNLQ